MQPAPLPTLTPADHPLVNAFLELDGDITAVAARLKKPLADLTQWALSAPVQAYLAGFRYLRNISHGLQETTRLHQACNKLSTLLETTTDPIEKRHIANALIRACSLLLRPYTHNSFRQPNSQLTNQEASEPQDPSHAPAAAHPNRSRHPRVDVTRAPQHFTPATPDSPTTPFNSATLTPTEPPIYNLSPEPFDLSAPLIQLPKHRRNPASLMMASSGATSLSGAAMGVSATSTATINRLSHSSTPKSRGAS